MNIRLYNARILTMEKGIPIFFGEVWIKNEKIVYIGETDKMEAFWKDVGDYLHWDKEIDCEGNLLMPGFKNAHTHSGMTFLRSYADDLPLQKWLKEKVFPMEAKIAKEDLYYFVKLAVLEYLTSGITTIFDMYLAPDITARACMDMGMRCVLASGLNDFTSSISEMAEQYSRWNSTSPLIRYHLGFHAEYTCSKQLLMQLASLAHHLQAPVYAHMNETLDEVKECKRKYGMTPAVFLDSLGLFRFGGGGYHCIHMSEEDMNIFIKRGMYVITNPASNMKLASGIAPIKDFLDRSIPVAIGTDGPASNNCLDMFREMFLVSGLSRLKEQDAAGIEAGEVLKMATVNGARAMHLKDAEVLREGKLADIIMIDLNQPNMHPVHNIGKNLVYSGSKQNVKMTMVGGRILYMDGKFDVGEEITDIYKESERIVNRLMR
mgnify:FL=1